MRARTILSILFAASLGVAAVVGCGRAPTQRSNGTASPSASAPLDPNVVKARAEQGEKLFVAWCGGCHGDHGRGDGPAAAVLVPKPRNFVTDKFKIRSTPGGKPPRRDDILATVTRGLPGTPMPSFAFLTEDERNLIVDHVWRLAGLDKKPEAPPIAAGTEPASTRESVARGKDLYAKLGCANCHGVEGRGDGPSSKDLHDDKGQPLPARDYTKGLYLGGDTAAAIRTRFLTGMDGTPMPSFADTLPNEADAWDLAHFILSLRAPKELPPSDAAAWGKSIVEEKRCAACHIVEGQGGQVGPSLDVIGAKLRFDWAKSFLADPPAKGKIYPYTPYRMPNLGLAANEVDAVLSYLASNAHRSYPEAGATTPTFEQATIDKGKLIYFLRCTECHNMGTVIPTPLAKQQGPDLINVSARLRYEFVAPWVRNPKEFNPYTRMVVTNLTPEEVDQVSAFVWSTSVAGLQAPTK
jgi:cytochrome c oxidase cbb3-type subunit 2